MKTGVIISMIFLAGIGVGTYLLTDYNKGIDTTLTKVVEKKLMDNGKVKDAFNEIGVKGLEDIAIKQEGEDIVVHYGKTIFKVKKDQILTKEINDNLNRLGIRVITRNDGSLGFLYKDQLIKEIQ